MSDVMRVIHFQGREEEMLTQKKKFQHFQKHKKLDRKCAQKDNNVTVTTS